MPKDDRVTPEWNERYKTGDLPWETGRPVGQLISIVAEYDIAPCKALELGCGTGNNSIWLSEQGFNVTATDISPLAIDVAVGKSGELHIQYVAADILTDFVPDAPYAFVFDRGCLHCAYI